MGRFVGIVLGTSVLATIISSSLLYSRLPAKYRISRQAYVAAQVIAAATCAILVLLVAASRIHFQAILAFAAFAALMSAAVAVTMERRLAGLKTIDMAHASRLASADAAAAEITASSDGVDTVEAVNCVHDATDSNGGFAASAEAAPSLSTGEVATREVEGVGAVWQQPEALGGSVLSVAQDLARRGRGMEAVACALGQATSVRPADGLCDALVELAQSVTDLSDFDMALAITIRLLVRPDVGRNARLRQELVSFQRYLHARRAAATAASADARMDVDALAVHAQRKLAKIDSMLRR
ncbi:MAG: hypothetical protein VB144_13240 [Clostridia bacterium]|nr:hypothetical protein [Clostridia bacterium]